MIFRSLIYLLLSPVLIFSSSLQAEVITLAESDFFDEAPLILTASRMSKPLSETPASVTVIDRQMIESSGARALADIFRLVPGFIVGNFSGNTPVVSYHGLGTVFHRQLQVLIDGRSVYIPSFGGVPWANLPLLLEDIERVEVIRGPNAVTYGANAFLATINIITRHSAEDAGARYSITTSDNSNPDITDAYLRLGYHFNDLDWRLSLGTLNDDGFESVYDSRETNKVNFRLDYLSSHNSFWTFQLGTSNSISGKGEAGEPTDIERDEDATNSYFNINWEQVQGDSTTNIRLTHTEQEVIDNFATEPFTIAPITNITTFIDFNRVSNRTDLEIVQTDQINDGLRLVYGGSLRKDRVKSLFLKNDKRFHDVDVSRLFTSVEWRIDDNWILDVGATLEDTSITEQEYSPRFSILRKMGSDHVFRFVASRARRNPILFEHSGLTIFSANGDLPGPVNTDFTVKINQGNPEIEPEDIVSYELGLRSILVDNLVSADVKLFRYKITDFIDSTTFFEPNATLPINDEVATSINDNEAQVEGVELSIDIIPSQKLTIKTGLSLISAESTDIDAEESYPDSTAFFTAQYQWQPKHIFSGAYYYVDDMNWLDAKEASESINKLDLRYAYVFDEASEMRIELIGQNLLEDYADYLPGNTAEKLYLLRVSGGF